MPTFMPNLTKFTPQQFMYITKCRPEDIAKKGAKAFYHDWHNDVWYYEKYTIGELRKIKIPHLEEFY